MYLTDATTLGYKVEKFEAVVPIDPFIFFVDDFGLDNIGRKRVADYLNLGMWFGDFNSYSHDSHLDCPCKYYFIWQMVMILI